MVILPGTFKRVKDLDHVQVLAEMRYWCCKYFSSLRHLLSEVSNIAHVPLKGAMHRSSASQSISANKAGLSLKSAYSKCSCTGPQKAKALSSPCRSSIKKAKRMARRDKRVSENRVRQNIQHNVQLGYKTAIEDNLDVLLSRVHGSGQPT